MGVIVTRAHVLLLTGALLACVLGRKMVADDAAADRSKNSMVMGKVPGNTTDGRAL